MKQIHEFLKNHNIKPTRYQKLGKVYFIEVDGEKYAIKRKENDLEPIYNYLNARNFNYYPNILASEDFEITKVVDDIEYPLEQKITDLIDVTALLHSKTSFYKEVESDYFKKIYEDINGNIEYLEEYYSDIITMIEKEIYMSPSYYLIARNINLFFDSIYYAKENLEKWYGIVSSKNKVRFVVLHNNLSLDHFLKGDNAYLISWDKSKIDLPIFDLYKLYKRHALDFDFEHLLLEYEKKYPLLEEERILLFILISLPNKITWKEEFKTCLEFTKEIDLMYKTRNWIQLYGENKK